VDFETTRIGIFKLSPQIKLAFIIENLDKITSQTQQTFYTMQSLLKFSALMEKTKRDFKSKMLFPMI
jgi:hypothetical protein